MLVMLDQPAAGNARQMFADDDIRVVQSYGPSIVVVDADPEKFGLIETKPEVRWVATGKIAKLPDIDPSGKIGIQVWNANYDARPKERKWDGYSWGWSEAEKEG